MGNISNEQELKARIRELELKTVQQQKALKENARVTAESFKPANLLQSGFSSVRKAAVNRDIRSVAINTFIGLTVGYLTRKIFIGKKSNILKRTIGAAVQAGMTKLVFRKLPVWQQKTMQLISGYKDRRGSNHL